MPGLIPPEAPTVDIASIDAIDPNIEFRISRYNTEVPINIDRNPEISGTETEVTSEEDDRASHESLVTLTETQKQNYRNRTRGNDFINRHGIIC